MKAIFKSIMLLAMVTSTLACESVSLNPDSTPEEKKSSAPVINIASGNELILYPAPSGKEITIDFEINADDDIIEVTAIPSSGIAAELKLSECRCHNRITVKALDGMPAKGKISITAKTPGGTDEKTIEVSKAYISIDKSTFRAKTAGVTFIVSVSSNVHYDVLLPSSQNWIRSYRSGNEITVTIDRNETFSERTAEIRFTDTDRIISETLTINQDAAIDYLSKERAALVAIWNATNGENWVKISSTTGGIDISTENWNTDKPISQWYGVEVNSDGHVVYLHLSSMGLSGTLPEEIGDLVYCQDLWLSGNNLSGPLPSRIGEMQCLKDLSADGMALSGNLSESSLSAIAGHLKSLSLSGNDFTGEFPAWVGEMPQTCNFWLQGNRLSGEIPDAVKNHPNWSKMLLDGSGKTVGQLNMEQQEGYELTE